MFESYFPKGLAVGHAFCNRVEERERLKRNFSACQHTLIISPRRYGKTSLVKYLIEELELANGQADLFVAVDALRIEQMLLKAIMSIVQQVAGTLESAIRLLTTALKKVNSQWTIGTKGINIVLTSDNANKDPAQNIQEALLALDLLLQKKKQKAVLFIDEMQEIAEVAEGKGIEGAIRHVAQETRHIIFVFSGSKRHMLAKMFFDKSRPLYKLCDKMLLTKISEKDYDKHLNALAKKKWGHTLSRTILDKIYAVTALHPYYINSLCLHLWSRLKLTPTIPAIDGLWMEILKEDRLEISKELSSLSHGQRKILVAIAEGYNTVLTGKYFLKKIDLSASATVEAIRVLEEKEYLEKNDKGEYEFIDPLIKSILVFYYVS